MAGFVSTDTKRASVKKAMNLQDLIRGFHHQGNLIKDALALYGGGSDPAFTASINAVYDASERAVLNQMLTNINTLVNAWEADNT
ncbi:hypothetical protein, partial [Salmonella sp. SAL4432]|uniref:hypothetical protein n=1 Tax=Salmonella sp. SAL4432 TaxID=3159887 RepID=UPI00397D2D10